MGGSFFDAVPEGADAYVLGEHSRVLLVELLACDLPDDAKVALLTLPDANGDSALQWAAKNEHGVPAATAFTALVERSELAPSSKAALLASGLPLDELHSI